MGLPTVQGIVLQSGGHIEVSSQLGRGTTVDVLLPRVEPPGEVSLPERAEFVGQVEQATILVVEDNDAVRDLTAATLEAAGYRVLRAENAAAAMARSGAEPGPIDLLLSDVVMPGIGGVALGRRLRQSRPQMRALFMSGYSEDVVEHHGQLDQDFAFISKPFTPNLLAARVREVLRRPPHPRN